ncbi:class E sortase [Streptomyces sp. SR27]|uniref:class E sortase n=1 Tax=Streptomyces sp. SR27 TaxID=3076630 RepID=UPI00295A786E|nr:class E sortase [Streptomyces sp. SR27]MDV9188412.1 class E sortase [Streptomyces sp. SR27]
MRARVGQRIPVVVQSRGRRRSGARVLFVCAETVVTCGVLVLLLVVHQLWWTNLEARAEALDQVRALEQEWAVPLPEQTLGEPTVGAQTPGGDPADEDSVVGDRPDDGASAGASAGSAGEPASPGTSRSDAFAVLRIPRLGLTVPVAHGVSKRSVLDKGYVGHYSGTGDPGRVGNFALAGHRNTHGEPFRYINRLEEGDEISVRTRARTYVYRVDQVLRQTAPRDVGVIRPVPRSLVKPSYGYDAPGAYLTLTTCTPEFSSTYRLVVWAKLVR